MKVKAVLIVLAVFLLMAIPSIAMNQGPWATPSTEIADEIIDNAIEPMITPVDNPQSDGGMVYHKPPGYFPRSLITTITPTGDRIDDDIEVVYQRPPGIHIEPFGPIDDVEVVYIVPNDDLFPFPPSEMVDWYIEPFGPIDDDIEVVYQRPPLVRTLTGLFE